mgnify:FL=1|tara:strand:- start:2680 stop:2934 length:255 start_codon:yes stop_codon:yes gene_type:complete
MSNLKEEIKKKLIQHLNLEELNVNDIKDDTPLFGEGIGLDSIDVLEIIVLLDKHYNIKITKPEDGEKIFQTVNSLAEYIESHNG